MAFFCRAHWLQTFTLRRCVGNVSKARLIRKSGPTSSTIPGQLQRTHFSARFRSLCVSRTLDMAIEPVKCSAECAPAAGPYSAAIKANGMIFCSGQIPADKDGNLCQGDIQACTKQVITNLENVLKSAGSGLDKVVKMNIFLASMDDFAKMNETYSAMLPDPKPARSCVAVKTLPKNVTVEIECIALQ